MVKRAAFTLIELIFAIVIIAIVFLSLPSLSSTNSDAVETSLLQEAIFPMSARLSQVLSYKWDDNSESNTSINSEYAKVVDLNGDPSLNRVANTNQRVGHIQENDVYHRQFHPRINLVDYNASGIAFDGADDIDDFDTNGTVSLYTRSGDLEGYKKNYLIDINVAYSSDAIAGFAFTNATALNSNMKIVTISLSIPLSDGSFDANAIVLRSYAANIGEALPYSRTY